MNASSLLLPKGIKPVGAIFTIAGTILGMAWLYFDFKPGLLNLKVFAIYSSFLRTRSMVVIRNQMVEEIAGMLILAGLFMIALSREQNESDRVNATRLKAFFISIYLNTLFLITGILFTYGIGFIKMMTLDLFSWLAFYIIPFRIMIYLDHKKQNGLPFSG